MGCNGCGVDGLVSSLASALKSKPGKGQKQMPRLYLAQVRGIIPPKEFSFAGGMYSVANGIHGDILLVADESRPWFYCGGELAANLWFETESGKSDRLRLEVDLSSGWAEISFRCGWEEIEVILFSQRGTTIGRSMKFLGNESGGGGSISLVPFQS